MKPPFWWMHDWIAPLSRQIAAKQGAEVVAVSAQVEAELAEIEDEEERASFLEELGVDGSGLSNLVQAAYRQLGLLTFFTAGEKEARAWTVRQGACAPEAAGQIHSDMQRGFICAETVSFDDFVRCNGWDGAKEEGKLRQEGKDYVVQDGDVRWEFHFIIIIIMMLVLKLFFGGARGR